MSEWFVCCPECESKEWLIGDRATVTCAGCGHETTLEWVNEQQEGF